MRLYSGVSDGDRRKRWCDITGERRGCDSLSREGGLQDVWPQCGPAIYLMQPPSFCPAKSFVYTDRQPRNHRPLSGTRLHGSKDDRSACYRWRVLYIS